MSFLCHYDRRSETMETSDETVFIFLLQTMTEGERLFIGNLLKKERDSLLRRRHDRMESFKKHVRSYSKKNVP